MKERKTGDNPYLDEYVNFDAAKIYGMEFDEAMKAADDGLIRRRSHVNSRGSEVFTFRRGDLIAWCDRRAENGSR